MLSSPRFDTLAQAALNVIGIALWLTVVAVLVRQSRRGQRLSAGDWLAIIVNVSVGGVYVPVGPVAWLVAHGSSIRATRVNE